MILILIIETRFKAYFKVIILVLSFDKSFYLGFSLVLSFAIYYMLTARDPKAFSELRTTEFIVSLLIPSILVLEEFQFVYLVFYPLLIENLNIPRIIALPSFWLLFPIIEN